MRTSRPAGFCVLWAAAVILAGGPGGGSELSAQNPDPQQEYQHHLRILRNSRLELPDRQMAASILMGHNSPSLVADFKADLAPGADPVTQRAIARAIAHAPQPPADLQPLLLELLSINDPLLRQDLATALTQYSDPKVLEMLVARATGAKTPVALRVGSIHALSEYRTKEVVETLIGLMDAGDMEVKTAAFSALQNLTGNTAFGTDAQLWRQWWEETRWLPQARWLALLIKKLAAGKAESDQTRTNLTDRLGTAYRDLYDARTEPQRQAMLRDLLGDPLESMRVQALSLIERRVLLAQPVGDELQKAVRDRLTDRVPAVRAQAAMVLVNLKDAEGARQVVNLLLSEADPRAQTAYLKLLGRVPRLEAVVPAVTLLEQPAQRSAAAAFLMSASEAGLLQLEQKSRALAVARKNLETAESPDPAVIGLIGRLGEESDQAILARMLDHREPDVRRAAVETFGLDRWPLKPLLEKAGDPQVGTEAVAVIGRRGSDSASVLALLMNEPDAVEARAKWTTAVLAVGARLDAAATAEIDVWFRQKMRQDTLHEDFLKAAAGLDASAAPGAAPQPRDEGRRFESEMLLADLYRRRSEPAKAEAIYQRLVARNGLTPERLQRLSAARVSLLLQQGQTESAAKLSAQLLGDKNKTPSSALVEVWSAAILSAVQAKQFPQAEAFYQSAKGVLGDPDSLKRLEQVKKQMDSQNPRS